MPESPERAKGFFFNHREIAADLVKKQGLHEGRWRLTIEIGLSGTSLFVQQPDGSQVLTPAGVVLITAIGIIPTTEVNNLTVDAAEVNPAPAPKTQKSTKRPTKKGR